MDVFIIDVPNQPGELAKASQALGGQGVNIETVGALGSGDRGVIGLITSAWIVGPMTTAEAKEVFAATGRVAAGYRPGGAT